MTMKESETTEFKKSTAELKSGVVSIVAILNKHSKGELYFGIKDDGTVVGQIIGRNTIKEVTQTIVDNKEIPEIPVRAISEAIGNSLCHRDFENPKGNEVAIFKDRIEIYNPGFFPSEIDPEDFFSGHEHSILRNSLIAETMYKSKDIERLG